MKLKNINSIHGWHHLLSIVNCQLFVVIALFTFPLSLSAQDEEETEQVNTVVTLKEKKKAYVTKPLRGRVIDAATKTGLGGCIVKADGIDGYSVLTEDDGTYDIKVPEFATALYITSPDHNPVRMGIINTIDQNEVMLYPSTFIAEYEKDINLRGDKSATDFK